MSIFTGFYQLITSPSGVFALLCLLALSVLTWHVGGGFVAAWTAFFTVVPTALGLFEHKETVLQMQQQAPPVVDNNLPDKGQM